MPAPYVGLFAPMSLPAPRGATGRSSRRFGSACVFAGRGVSLMKRSLAAQIP